MSDGFEYIVTPYNTSEWEELVAQVRTHHNRNADRTFAVAAELRRLLPKAKNVSGRAGWGGIDLRVAAIKLARQINQAAACDIASASAWSKADQIFHGNFTSAGSGSARGFDAGK
jgi:hypothetical protein